MSSGTDPIRVVVVEDSRMVRDAFAQLLDLQDDVAVVGHAGDGQEALDLLADDPNVDIVVTDIEMPGMDGLELAQRLNEPASSEHESAPRVVVVTTFGRAGYLRRAMEAGVAGYVLKAAPIDEMVDALHTVHAGGRVIDPDLAQKAWTAPTGLTERERDVLRLAEDGVPNAEIAQRLHLAEGTVRNHVSSAITKLHARNRTEAATTARTAGLL